MDYEKMIIDSIEKLSGKFSPYQIFTDWVSMAAISISNSCRPFKDKVYLERGRIENIGRYDRGLNPLP